MYEKNTQHEYKMSNVGSNLNANQGSGSIKISTDKAGKVFIVPFIAEMSVDASGTIGVTQQADVTVTNIDAMFDVSMNLADSVSIINAFTVKDADSDFNKNGTDASSGTIVNVATPDSDRSYNFQVAIRHMLDECMTVDSYQAVGLEKTDVARRSLKEYIRYQGYSDTMTNLMMDTLAGFLEASDLNTFDVTLDVSGGAYNMATIMAADPQTHPDATPSAAAKYRRSLLTQLPESNIDKYVFPDPSGTTLSVEDITKIEFMPMLVGDKLVFVFDLTLGEVSATENSPWSVATKGAKIERVVIDRYSLPEVGAASTNTLGGVIDLDATENYKSTGTESLLITRPTKRRIAISAKLSTLSGDNYTEANTNAFHIEDANGNVFNPNEPYYSYASAAGLLGTAALETNDTDLKASTSAWTESVPSFAVAAGSTSASIEINQGGGIAVSSFLILSTDEGNLTDLSDNNGTIGGWVVVNGSLNKNVFSVDTTDDYPVVKYSGKTITNGTDDTATLYRVTNRGLSEGVTLTASAHVAQD